MDWNRIYKIKDSVDIYLVNEEYIIAYFMNTRIQKKFRVNPAVIMLFECIDGVDTAKEIYRKVSEKDVISKDAFAAFIDKLLETKILCEKLQEHILDEYYLKRYDRQINYFVEFLGSEKEAEIAQQKLINTRIGLIGCGAIGGNIAIQLAMAGVERFVLMDYDVIEESDCARHIYYNIEDVGRRKVEVLSDKLKAINSRVKTWISYAAFTPDTDMDKFLDNVDFVIDAADEPYMGYTANVLSRLCIPRNMPHYIAGGFDAHLASTGELIIPYVTPCAACYSSYFEKVLSDWKPEKHPVIDRINEIGGLSSMSLFSTSYANIEIIKYICGLMNMEKEYHNRAEFYFDGMKMTYLTPKRDPNCKVCGKHEV